MSSEYVGSDSHGEQTDQDNDDEGAFDPLEDDLEWERMQGWDEAEDD